MRVGLVADTHGLLDPALPDLLSGCDLVLHAGDVGDAAVLAGLARAAPVLAVRGNVDSGPGLCDLPEWRGVALGALQAVLVHEARPASMAASLRRVLARNGARVVVHGHSHRPGATVQDGILFVNPGSAGPRRFSLPRTAATMEVEERRVRVLFHVLAPGRPAPPEAPVVVTL